MRAFALLAALVVVAATAGAAGGTGAGALSIPNPTYGTNGSVHAEVTSGGITYLGGAFTEVGLASGPGVGIDATAGTSTSLPGVSGGNNAVYAVAADGSGGFYVGGDFTHVGGIARHDLAHILGNGTVDPSFDPSPDGIVHALALSGSLLYVGGAFAHVGGQPRANLAAVDASSGAATTWDPHVTVGGSGGLVRAIALSPTPGTVYVGGSFTNIGSESRRDLAALSTASGAPTSWDPEPNSDVLAIAVSGGTVYIGGAFFMVGSTSVSHVAGISSITDTLITFHPNVNGNVNAIAVSGSTVYMGGSFSSVGGLFRNGIARADTSGNVDTNWNPNATFTVDALAASGSVVYAGGLFTTVGGVTRTDIAAISTIGAGAPTSWDPEVNNEVFALAVSSSGSSVYAGGLFDLVNTVERDNLAAVDDATGRATSWNPVANAAVQSLALSTSGPTTVYAAGLFTAIGPAQHPIPVNNLAAIDTTGALESWAPAPIADGTPEAIATLGSTVYVGGSFDAVDAIDASTGNLDSGFTATTDGTVSSLVASGSTVYAGGSFATVNGAAHSTVVALNASTGSAQSWNAAGAGSVASLALSGTTLYVGGAFTSMGGQPRSDIAALNTATGAATTWTPSADGPVTAIALDGPSVFVGGQFGTIGGQSRNELAELDATTGNATSWNPDPNSPVNAILATPMQIMVGGGFTTFDAGPAAGFAIFGRVTSPPAITSFSPASGPVGAQVTISGSNFTGATGVSFGSTPALSFSVDSDTQITAFVKSGTSSGHVSVTNTIGTGTSSGLFTVISPPTITSVSPAHGSYGASVTVTGTNLGGATSVKLNGTSVTFTPISAFALTFTVPVGASTGAVSVTTPGGTATSASTFFVNVLPPLVSSFTPTSGTIGAAVKINGAHFSGASAVTFNGSPATFTVVTDGQIVAHVPVSAATGKIAVTSPGGTITSVAVFTVVPAIPAVPTITSFTPTSGLHGVSTTLIKGTGFTGTTSVSFNGTNAAFLVLSDTLIKAYVPALATSGQITVTAPGGSVTSAASFTVT